MWHTMVEEVEAAINPYAFWKDGPILLRVDRPFTLSINLRSHSAFVDHDHFLHVQTRNFAATKRRNNECTTTTSRAVVL